MTTLLFFRRILHVMQWGCLFFMRGLEPTAPWLPHQPPQHCVLTYPTNDRFGFSQVWKELAVCNIHVQELLLSLWEESRSECVKIMIIFMRTRIFSSTSLLTTVIYKAIFNSKLKCSAILTKTELQPCSRKRVWTEKVILINFIYYRHEKDSKFYKECCIWLSPSWFSSRSHKPLVTPFCLITIPIISP
jgi:hypothetical protein